MSEGIIGNDELLINWSNSVDAGQIALPKAQSGISRVMVNCDGMDIYKNMPWYSSPTDLLFLQYE